MPFVGAAIAAAAGITGLLGTITAGIINTGIAIGLSYVARSLLPGAQVEAGIKTTLELGGDQPRGFVLGNCGLPGHLVYGNTANENNNLMQMVFAIGEGPHEDLETIFVNGKERNLTLVSETEHYKKYSVSGFVAKNGTTKLLYVYFFHGYQDQPALDELVSWAKPADRWTVNDRLAGICHVVVSVFYGEEAFDTGIPRFMFGVKGRRLYDWRKDTTAGGMGAHRWTDEKTWEYSENPAVQIYNYQRGLYLGGEVVVGMGVPPVDLVLDRYTLAANACDETVPEAEGGEADRYRCSTYVGADEEHGVVMARLLDSCAGSLYERVGAYAPIVGVAQSIVYPTFSDDDLIIEYPRRFVAKLGRAELVNSIYGRCTSADEQYELVSYAARTNATAEAEDTEKRPLPVDYPQVNVQSQAQRLAQVQLNLARLQATATVTLGYSAITLEPGDWVRWNSARFGNRVYIILSLTQNTDQTVTLNLRETAAAAFGWSADDELPAPALGAGPDGSGLISAVPAFGVSAMTMTGTTGAQAPAVRATWLPISDPTVVSVLIEYRITGTTDVLSARLTAVGLGEAVIGAGIVADTAYEFRATIETVPSRATEWTGWASVTTTGETLPAGAVGVAQLEAAIKDQVLTRTQAALASLNAGLDQLALLVADVDAAGDLNRRELVRALAVQVGAASARFSEQIAAAVGPDSALVQQVTDLAAAVGGVEAGLVARFVVGVAPSGAIAAYELEATAQGAAAGFRIIARDDGAGGAIGEVQVEGDRFFVSGGDGLGVPVFLVDTSGPTPLIALNGDLIASGSITGAKIAAATIETLNLVARSVTADVISIGGVVTENIAPAAVTAIVSETLTTGVGGSTATDFTVFETSINRSSGAACIVRFAVKCGVLNVGYQGGVNVTVKIVRTQGATDTTILTDTYLVPSVPGAFVGGAYTVDIGGGVIAMEHVDADSLSGVVTYKVILSGLGFSPCYARRTLTLTEYKR